MLRFPLLTCLFCLYGALWAQPANDDCGGAIALPDDAMYCSGANAFTTVGATTSLAQEDYAICLDERDQIKDVWFSFRATRNSVAIQVTGAVPGRVRGTLQQVQFSLMGGGCGALDNLACRSPFVSGGQIQNGGSLIYNELRRGETYYLLVGGRSGNAGSFELCLEQFDAVPDPSSDCSTGVVLCDKSPFAVQALQGTGNVRDDLLSDNVSCQSTPEEFNSSWYKWTCDQAGTLAFDITPLGAAPNEDIDFVVYELTAGLDACGDRQVLRQMFSGETQGNGDRNLACLGATGISEADPDTVENCGCDDGDNNYARAIDMEAGKSYALVIMNYTGSGDGFSIEFGGSGTFQGPEPNLIFSTTEVCVGESITFEDQSTSLDGIASREWDFGPTATPRTAFGAGPHTVTFAEAGSPSVNLVLTTTRNCIEYISSSEVAVVCCSDQYSVTADVQPVSCPEAADGSIALTASSKVAGSVLTYSWSNGQTTPVIDGLDLGTYAVSLTDGTGCTYIDSFQVGGPEPFVFDTLIVQPDCAGGTNGVLELSTLAGGAGDYAYSFGGGPFGPSGRLENLPVGIVNVTVRDANGCEFPQAIFVDERQLGLVAGSTGFIEPTCNGDADGQLDIQIANGIPDFRYDFGSGFQAQPRQGGFSAGTYPVTAVDAEGCTGEFEINITEPPLLELALQADSSSCFGANDGSVFATPSGGRPLYLLAWSDGVVGTDRVNLGPGTYRVALTDSLGCTLTDSVTLVDPGEIVATVVDQIDLVCFGDASGLIALGVTGGSPEYTYSADGVNFQSDSLLSRLPAGNYTLYVRDRNGCQDSLTTSLDQPEQFVLETDTSVRLVLGNDTSLFVRSNYSPVIYRWGPDSLNCLTPDCSRVRVMPVQSGDIFVTGVSPAGCVDTAFVSFSVIEDLATYIPNVISPNDDGQNDHFTVYGGRALARVEELRVYDRWGGLVYQSEAPFPANDPQLGWDGTLGGRRVNGGVYVYYAEVSYINGRTVGYRGDVTVLGLQP